jgi:hypothetical protein
MRARQQPPSSSAGLRLVGCDPRELHDVQLDPFELFDKQLGSNRNCPENIAAIVQLPHRCGHRVVRVVIAGPYWQTSRRVSTPISPGHRTEGRLRRFWHGQGDGQERVAWKLLNNFSRIWGTPSPPVSPLPTRGSLPAAGFALRARMSRQGGTAPHAFSIAKWEGGGHASAPFNSSEVGLIAVVSVPVLQRVALIIAV